MGNNVCSDLGERKKSSSNSVVDGPSTSHRRQQQQQQQRPAVRASSKLIKLIGSSSSSSPSSTCVNPTDCIIAGGTSSSIKMTMDPRHLPVLLTSNPPIPSSFDHLLDYTKNYSLSFDKTTTTSPTMIDFAKHDYRAFCLLVHRDHGAILLHCTRKKKKPPHYQLPGGHVDGVEFNQVLSSSPSKTSTSPDQLEATTNVVTPEQLYKASRIGCAREVYEETGLDFRDRNHEVNSVAVAASYGDENKNEKNDGGEKSTRSLDRFRPLVLYMPATYQEMQQNQSQQKTILPLINEYKHRLFFICEVYDEDFSKTEVSR
jgi:8-oxo-dGTP pyrophosphatase MutT (NUDIX family)